MLLSLSPLSEPAGSLVQVPPPPHFRAPLGTVRDVYVRLRDPGHVVGNTAAQRTGLLYEQRVQEYLCELLSVRYLPFPELHFHDDRGVRTCIPDGIYTGDNYNVIFEIKVQHMPEAYWQLEKLYRPVVEARMPHRKVFCVEIVKSYDPCMPFPCRVKLFTDLVAHIESPSVELGVCQWGP